MTIKTLVCYITKQEGKKSQVNIGDASEIIGIISDLIYAPNGMAVVDALFQNGLKRSKKKKSRT